MAKASLKEYKSKRNFEATPEPQGTKKSSSEPIFVVHEHHARRLHYDVRLEHKGVLKSWAVPKGPPLDRKTKHLAVQTEDHPLDYASFHGTIPKGNYGAGQVSIWDSGTYENIGKKDGKPITLDQAFEKGHLKILFHGKKLKEVYSLIKTGRERQWLMIQTPEEPASSQPLEPEKISTDEGVGEIWRLRKPKKDSQTLSLTNPQKIIFPQSNITKADLVDYYEKVAFYILPHLQDRPLVMERFPDGINGERFFQKDIPSYFPDWIQRHPIKHDKGTTTYVVCNSKEVLSYVANQVIIPHTWLSTIHALEYPNKLIFDLDPQGDHIQQACQGAEMLKELFDEINLNSFVMSTGSRGLHVIIPLDAKLHFEKVSSFARLIAKNLQRQDPKTFTAEQRKDKRRGKVFVDTYRNAFSQTAVCPYAVRAIEHAPIATPLEWKELSKNFNPQQYTISNIFERLERKGDVWQAMSEPQSLKEALKSIEA